MMQADRRLVQDVEDAAQLRSDLRRQANALAFYAGECGGGAAKLQVAESDVVQEIEGFGDFVCDASGDGQFPARQLDAARGFERTRNRKLGEIGNRHAIHFYSQAFRAQTFAVAYRALRGRHEIEQIFAIGVGGGGFKILPEVAENPEKTSFASALRLAVQQEVLNLVGEFLEGSRQVETVGQDNQLQAAHQVLR